jgi:hypothetical protein
MVYVWHRDDADPHEWVVDLNWKEAEELENRLEDLLGAAIYQNADNPVVRDVGVVLMTHSPATFSDMLDWIADTETDLAPTVPARG